MSIPAFLFVWLAAFIDAVAGALIVAIFVRVILSWIPGVRLPFGLGEFVWSVSETVLGPIRRALPFMGGLDLSPLVAYFLIQIVASLLHRLLLAVPYGGF